MGENNQPRPLTRLPCSRGNNKVRRRRGRERSDEEVTTPCLSLSLSLSFSRVLWIFNFNRILGESFIPRIRYKSSIRDADRRAGPISTASTFDAGACFKSIRKGKRKLGPPFSFDESLTFFANITHLRS